VSTFYLFIYRKVQLLTMAQRAIREYEGKRIFDTGWANHFGQFRYDFHAAGVATGEELLALATDTEYAWLREAPLVVKPDMVFGKRGLNDLVLYKLATAGDVRLDDAARWIDQKRAQTTTLLSGQSGVLSRFIVEPFVVHDSDTEYYIAAVVGEDSDTLSISAQGGVHIEDNWDRVRQIEISPFAGDEEITALIAAAVPEGIAERDRFILFATDFYRFFRDRQFSYLEVNPFCFDGDRVYLLDMVAKVDDTAGFLMEKHWGPLYFPTPFGMKAPGPEEKRIKEIDEKSGASLKLTVLNPSGRVWTLVAGGGASVVYADTIADLIGTSELANYGEYSGNPTTRETRVYAETVLDLMTREPDPQGREKLLIIGGAIANFTDVAKTFTGIIQALREYHEKMRAVGVRIYVRRGGPNFEVGLRNMKQAAQELGLPIEVYGPETHMTDIVRMALTA
jgi:ATP-citrate lyase beta-subunit